MPTLYKVIVFFIASIGIVWVSRSSLKSIQYHGFYRFFAWEFILVMFLINMNYWFKNPFSVTQILSWIFLCLSLWLIYQGVLMFRKRGKIEEDRNDPGLVGIEKTTELVTTGVYKFIRHPFYSSLLFLAWGIVLKNAGWYVAILAVITTGFLIITAKKEEKENIKFFGEQYKEYMEQTKMFIPYVL